MVMDSVLVPCPRCKASAIFARFLFPAMAGRRISPYIMYYSFSGSCAGETARVVPFLSVCSPGGRAETALRASQKWEFPFPGKFWHVHKTQNCSSNSTQNGLPEFSNTIRGGMKLRYSEDLKISWTADWQSNPWAGLDLFFAPSVSLPSAIWFL